MLYVLCSLLLAFSGWHFSFSDKITSLVSICHAYPYETDPLRDAVVGDSVKCKSVIIKGGRCPTEHSKALMLKRLLLREHLILLLWGALAPSWACCLILLPVTAAALEAALVEKRFYLNNSGNTTSKKNTVNECPAFSSFCSSSYLIRIQHQYLCFLPSDVTSKLSATFKVQLLLADFSSPC